MDYFVLKQDERVSDAPILLDVRKQLDIRDIRWTSAHKIADTLIFQVKAERESCYSDVLDGQLFLVSERLKRLIEAYVPDTLFKMTPLVDVTHHRQSSYYLPIFEEVEALGPSSERVGDGSVIKKLVLHKDKMKGKRIARVRESAKPLIVVRLDVAESILRRDFEGIRLERVAME
ncbi:hypothetical protein [Paenibacillus rigui]|nr:hypothetical protein [Paenibacillus rigui]